MILTLIFQFFLTLINSIIVFINPPAFPSDITSVFTTVTDYFYTGRSLLNNFFTPEIFDTCITIFIAVEICDFIYDLVMWIIRKVPGVE